MGALWSNTLFHHFSKWFFVSILQHPKLHGNQSTPCKVEADRRFTASCFSRRWETVLRTYSKLNPHCPPPFPTVLRMMSQSLSLGAENLLTEPCMLKCWIKEYWIGRLFHFLFCVSWLNEQFYSFREAPWLTVIALVCKVGVMQTYIFALSPQSPVSYNIHTYRYIHAFELPSSL